MRWIAIWVLAAALLTTPAGAQTAGAALDDARALDAQIDVFFQQGRYGDAEPALRRALAIYERALGEQSPEVAVHLNDLSVALYAQGKLAEAEPVAARALRLREATVGPSHPDTALSLDNLATVYRAQRRLADAAGLHERALAIREQAYGRDNPMVGDSLLGLGAVYREQGRSSRRARTKRSASPCRSVWPSSIRRSAATPRRWRSRGARWRHRKPCSGATTRSSSAP